VRDMDRHALSALAMTNGRGVAMMTP